MTAHEIQQWLLSRISVLAEIDPDEIDVGEPLTSYGLGSRDAISLSGELEDLLGSSLSPTLVYEYPTIEVLANFLADDNLLEPQSKVDQVSGQIEASEQIAIVGIGCRFPGAHGPAEFWQLLEKGIDAITEVPSSRWNNAEFYDSETTTPGKMNTRWGGFLDRVDHFDPQFFKISPREAERMDPQQRLLLQTVWEALEDAAIVPETIQGSKTGIFIGISNNDYGNLQANQLSLLDAYSGTGNARSIAANRLSYFFDLHGPSVALDTACSSSLVAVHVACRSLINKECSLALAGGVNVMLSPHVSVAFAKTGLLSNEGRCKVFDEDADGYVRGEGVGVVVLKPLSQAVAAGDPIYAVIRASATNQDGRTNGLSAPNGHAQEALFREVYERAGVSPAEVDYVETHGAGTLLGDRIEAAALGSVMREGRSLDRPCTIGSVKSNIGHLEAAAGIAGLIKVVLSLKEQQIPRSLHFQKANPHIDFAALQLRVQRELGPWPLTTKPALAGISSFGFGGTNCHVVLEQFVAGEVDERRGGPYVLPLSAKTERALSRASENLAQYLGSHPEVSLADVSHTLQTGRTHFTQRRTVVCEDREQAIKLLLANDNGSARALAQGHKRSLAFMFSGAGGQYAGMAAELYEREPAFRAAFDECCELLLPHLERDLRDIVFTRPAATKSGVDLRRWVRGPQSQTRSELNRTIFCQPALFVTAYALAQLLMSWGIEPDVMIGYSIGEYVAACFAGVMSLEDALRAVAGRAKLIQQLPSGGMLAVVGSETAVKELPDSELSIAIDNGPVGTIVAGPVSAVEALERKLTEQAKAFQRIETEHAFHSTMMAPLYDAMVELMQTVELNPPRVPYVSNVTGTWISAAEATDAHYWARHLCETVRFSAGVTELLKQPDRIFLEVGPGQSLATIVQQHANYDRSIIALPTLRPEHIAQPDVNFLLATLGQLWVATDAVDWHRFSAGKHARRVSLPTYPYDEQRYWLEGIGVHDNSVAEPLTGKKPDRADWFYLPSWKETMLPDAATSVSSSGKRLLVFADEGAVAASISDRARSLNPTSSIITVRIGHGFKKLATDTYTINPAEPDDYRKLVQELAKSQTLPAQIIHFWNLTHSDQLSFNEYQDRGFYSLAFLARALGEFGTGDTRLTVIADKLHDISGDEEISPAKSTLLSACRVIPQEYPNISCSVIGVALARNDVAAQKQIASLFVELTSVTSDRLVAYRGGRRWMQSFQAVRLEKNNETPSRLRNGGVYLISGGLGYMGLAFAETIVRHTQAKLVLTSRSGLPARDEWDEWLSDHGEHDPTSHKIRRVRELEALGGEVLVFAADVADEQRMREVIDATFARFGDLNGVIHAAGVISADSFVVIQELERRNCEPHFRAKVEGLIVLEKLLRERQLDFYLLLSSLSCFIGGLGFAPYAAANLFMDAFARKQNQCSRTPWLCVNWEVWEVREQALFNDLNAPRWEASVADYPVSVAEGVDVFERVMSAGSFTHLINSTGNLQARIDRWANFGVSEARKSVASARSRSLSTAYVGPRNEIEEKMAAIWQQLLGIAQVGVHDNFFELGGDSIRGIQFTAAANQAGFRLNPKQILTAPTIAELAGEVIASKSVNPCGENTAAEEVTPATIPVTAFQQVLLQQRDPQLSCWTYSLLLRVAADTDSLRLRETVRRLRARHDALRLGFVCDAQGWTVVTNPSDEDVPFETIDLPGVSAAEQETFVRNIVTERRSRLNPFVGPVMHAMHFSPAGGEPAFISLIVHRLVADNSSWITLLREFQVIYENLESEPPQANDALIAWSRYCSQQAPATHSPLNLSNEADLCRFAAESTAVSPAFADFSIDFTRDETQLLLGNVTKRYRGTVEELLLTGLAQAFAKWTTSPSLLVDFEQSARRFAPDDLDLSNTVTCFRHVSPVLLGLRPEESPVNVLKRVKQAVRGVAEPARCYSTTNGNQTPQAQIRFRYSPEQIEIHSHWFDVIEDDVATGSPIPGNHYALQVEAMAGKDGLRVLWSYNKNVCTRSTIEFIAREFVDAVRTLISESDVTEATACLPSDFPIANLNEHTLRKVSALIQKLETA
jgi:acyl transferase domain-containing protein/acyl carrier protein